MVPEISMATHDAIEVLARDAWVASSAWYVGLSLRVDRTVD